MRLTDQVGALESEKALLQSVLLNNDLFYAIESLTVDDFQTECHRKMFMEIATRIQGGQQVDEVILHDHFAGSSVGDYILRFDGLETKRIVPHVDEIRRASQRRRIIHMLEAAVAQSHDMSEENEAVLSVTYDRLLEIQEATRTSKSVRLSEFSEEFYARMERIANDELPSGGITTGLTSLDNMTGGLRVGEYVIVGAYTGEGKTSFATQIIAANCRFGIKSLLFSQEMSKEAVLARIIPQVAKGSLPAWKIRNPKTMVGSDRAIFAESRTVVDSWDMWVNDASTLHASDLVSQAHTMIRKHGIKLVVVDYLQLMKAEGEKRYEQVSNASAALRELAKSQGVVVIAVSQLARPEGKVKRAPSIWDLKQSGEIENDAHLVLFPFRPVDKKGSLTGKDFIIIGKQREGPVGRIPVEFDREKLTFVSRGDDGEPQDESEEGWWNK